MLIKYLKKLQQTLPVILLPVVSCMLLGPLEIYFGNQKDFGFNYKDFFGIFLSCALVLLIGMSIIVALLPNKLMKAINVLIFGIGLAFYSQNMFMNIKLSEVDGSPMRWNELGKFPIINLIIWLLIVGIVIFISLLLTHYWTKISITVSGFLCAIQIVAIFSLILTAGEDQKSYELQMSGESQFSVASNDNIIVFVLDTFGNSQLENAIAEYPDIMKYFNDFTYYSNADCHYYCTFPSMTHMLTGNEFDFDSVSQKWMQESWNSDRAITFWEILHNKNFTCNLYSSDIGYVYGDVSNLMGKFDNIKPVESVIDYHKLLKLLGKMSLYKYVPYVVKPYFEVLTSEFDEVIAYVDDVTVIDNNGLFYGQLVNEKLSIDKQMNNAIIIQHLTGTHQPYTLDENANITTETTVVQTVRGLVTIIDEYLQQMKYLGLYDNATIIVTADHGSWNGNDPQPIFFIKQAGEKHDTIEINAAPISLDDFQATILDILGIEYSEYGTSIFDWNENCQRERIVYMRMNDETYPNIKGSSFNTYYKYSYFNDKSELIDKINRGPEEILPATPWD